MTVGMVRRASRRLLPALALALFASCDDSSAPPRDVETPVSISAVLTPEQQAVVAGMSVEVTGPGIGTPIVATLDVAGANVNGTVRVPAGANRTFTVRAFDAQGVELYSGSATITVRPGDNPPLAIALGGTAAGTVPIDVTIGSYTIGVSPASATVARNASTTLTATVRDAGGNAVTTTEIQWGARNPVIARLAPGANGTATLTGGVAGTTDVVASWRGVAVAVPVTVTP